MIQKPIILMLTLIGMFLLSEKVTACDKKGIDKEVTHKIEHNQKISTQSECCDNHETKLEHNCEKNCSHQNCFCNSTFQNFFFNQKDVTLTLHDLNVVKTKFPIYRPSFYKGVTISVWHPPKVV
ncbi:MAG: hypothetical protein ACK5BU_05480 [Bacteroidota bacterium]|jgi:ABC-type nickel/cobalt efflux system permease component RcnA